MEEERYSNRYPNPSFQNKVPAPSILLDRFQSMVRERNDEMRNRNPKQSPPPLDMIEIVSFYEEILRELAFNSKPIITELTILAGNQRAFAEGIADAICTRISEVAPDQKLPSLYLLDSIVKNIGGEYICPFTSRLPEVFIGAWSRVHPSQHPSMRHLFKTWSEVFPSRVLKKIEDALQFNSSSSSGTGQQQQLVAVPVRQAQSDSPVDSPSLSCIHDNPMYLESPHQLNQDVSLQFPSKRSSILPPPKPPSPTRVGIRRSRSPPPDLYTDRPSTSHMFRNGYRVQNPNPRDLIDAYGGANRKIQRLENGREWKRSEEEFVWEHMSPTFSDRVRREQRERIGLYGPVSGLVGSRPDSRPVEPSYRRSWPRQGRLGPIDEHVYVFEERKPISSFGDAVAYKKNEGSIASHFEHIPYQHPSLNHVHESSKLPPYTGSMHMPANHGAMHHVRPPHNPAVVTRVMPPPLNAPRSSSVNSIRPLAPKIDYMRSAADTSLDANKPSLFVPSVSSGTVPVPVPVPVAGHMPARQPLMRHMQGTAAPTEALPQLLQPQLHSGVVRAPLPGNISMMPPLPPGPPPSSSAQTGLTSLPAGPTQSSSSAPGSFSGLLSTLMTQGIISLKPGQSPSEDALGFDFNLDLLKVRNESAINALYSELPRQCTTCGVRFQHQDEHSAHMDWHVTKNRVARNRKQKPSRKWYVSANEWLRGAETIGTEALPVVPAVAIEEEDVEVAVPADENQTACALCGELFEDFYSDETEEWMYKGAVFMNGTDGSGADTGTSSGTRPIVHAKCRPESTNA